MSNLGHNIAEARKAAGLTQTEFAGQLYVTRQTVSRWESGAASPDVETLVHIARALNVSCDALLQDDGAEPAAAAAPKAVSRLLQSAAGRQVKLAFMENEWDPDFLNKVCTVVDFEGNWMRVRLDTRKGLVEKLLPLSSIQSIELLPEAEA